jgi:hypothetical protein
LTLLTASFEWKTIQFLSFWVLENLFMKSDSFSQIERISDAEKIRYLDEHDGQYLEQDKPKSRNQMNITIKNVYKFK